MMEYLEGVKKAKTLEIGELLVQAEGTEVKVNGAVHTIRDMGNVAFVILRKRDGLVQCVFEEGVTAFDLKELKEASAVEVLGTIRKEERAAHGIEIRLKEIKVLIHGTIDFLSGIHQSIWTQCEKQRLLGLFV